jgi:hypothetical protein
MGDVVKMVGNEEPCVVYRVTDPTEEIMNCVMADRVPMLLPHVKIEIMGWVPVSFLVKARSVAGNMFAIDKILFLKDQCN